MWVRCPCGQQLCRKCRSFKRLSAWIEAFQKEKTGYREKRTGMARTKRIKEKIRVHNFPISGADPEYVLRPSINTQI